MRCLIIHNPASGPSSDEIYGFTHALAQGGDEVVMRFIGDGMEPEDAVADVREFDRVVVSGGDGTVSNVLDQMRGCGVPTLVFPSGTACLFFNNIGNAPEAAALAKACRAGRTVKVDMGELFWLDENGNEKRHGFIIIAGSGFDFEIMMKAAPTKNDIGEIAYFLSALATPNPTVAHFTIEHDGIVEELDGICCMAGNTSVIQNDINLFPNCRMNDGMVDIVVIEPVRTVQLLPTVITAPPARYSAARSLRSSRPKKPRLPARHRSACSLMARSSPATPASLAPARYRNALISSSTNSRRSENRRTPVNDNPILGFIVIVLAMLVGYAINVIHRRKK